jgi:type IV pilus assembly protein PilX
MSRMPNRRILKPLRAQRGVTLVIALIVLVAMTLAGVAMMRSVDTGTIVVGNLSFRQSSVHSADQGLQAGFSWILAGAGGVVLYDDANEAGVNSKGYWSSTPAQEPDWWAANTWTNAAVLNGGGADASGNAVSFIVHRLCTSNNASNNAPGQSCAATPDSTAITGEGTDLSSPNYFTRPPATHYRITSRSVGPRNSVAIVQTLVRTQ